MSIRDANAFSPRQSQPRRLQTLLGDSRGVGEVSNTTRTSPTSLLRPRARQAWSRKSSGGSQLASFYQQKHSVLLSSGWACVVQDQCEAKRTLERGCAVYKPLSTCPSDQINRTNLSTNLSRQGVETRCRDKVSRQGVESRCRDEVSRQGVERGVDTRAPLTKK